MTSVITRPRTTPSGSMIHVSGTFETPKATENRPSSSKIDRPVATLVGEEVLHHAVGLTTDGDGVELGAVGTEPGLLVDEADQLRVLAPAWNAVRREEVEHHPTALAA